MRFILPLLFILVAAGVGADPRTSYGVAFGPETGYGLSYRQEFGELGYQITGLPVVSNSGAFLSLGLQGFKTFHESPMTRFFGYLGASGTYDTDHEEASVGLGYGLELILLDHVVVTLQLGLGTGWTRSWFLDSSEDSYYAGVRAQGGLFYRL